MQYPGPPASSMTVTIHSGRELKCGDIFGKSDPFVKLELGGKEQKTTAKKGGSPVWEQTFSFNYSMEPSLKLYVYDKDFFRNDFLGVQDFPLLPVLTNPERHFHGEVGLTSKKGKQTGYLRITIQFYPKGDNTTPTTNQPAPQTPVAPVATVPPPQQSPAVQHIVAAPTPTYGVPAAGGVPTYSPMPAAPPAVYCVPPQPQYYQAPPPQYYPQQPQYSPYGQPAYPPPPYGYHY